MAAEFVLANTAPIAPPHVPELQLYLADEAHDLWLKTEDELAEIGLPPPFWAFAWAGGQVLARFILDHPEHVQGRHVVDFASGSGIVAIAAAKAGARHVTACDVDPFCRAAIDLNAALNNVEIAFEHHDMIGRKFTADCLLAGDVFYDREFAARLVPWFNSLTRDGVDIWIGDPGRAYLPRERMQLCATSEVAVTRALEDAEVKRSSVWRYTSTV
ncbi:methyltransferase [Aureimonas fodinaquatilis]|uniref:Methyltransferase n=1 Tax=Aureimonas fodinaquatilis TaxID=2565783 RepID=A0A5B0DSQ7_9HYPH|nr:methyltransferase [Aureimonas fodinaquatilis]